MLLSNLWAMSQYGARQTMTLTTNYGAATSLSSNKLISTRKPGLVGFSSQLPLSYRFYVVIFCYFLSSYKPGFPENLVGNANLILDQQVMEPHKHVKIEWIKWEVLWAGILIDIEDNQIGQQEKRFFPSMKNMVKKYPRRNDSSCLYRSLAQLVD